MEVPYRDSADRQFRCTRRPNRRALCYITALMPRDIDALTSATLKHLRERWWDAGFTSFLCDNLQPLAGSRILDVGCGVGTAEISLGLQGPAQVQLVGVDSVFDCVREALAGTGAHNIKAGFAQADAWLLPFPDNTFDSTFCVAVLQNVTDVSRAMGEFARVTKPGGRLLAVEPDNAARYWYSSTASGAVAFELGTSFFTALARARGDSTDPAVGPHMSSIFARHGVEPLAVHLFPVSVSRLGAPSQIIWESRLTTVHKALADAPDESTARLGADYLKVLEKYAKEANAAGPAFVEIQSTMLFATVGHRTKD